MAAAEIKAAPAVPAAKEVAATATQAVKVKMARSSSLLNHSGCAHTCIPHARARSTSLEI